MADAHLPSRLVCRIVSDILLSRAARLEHVEARTKPMTAEGRRSAARSLRAQASALSDFAAHVLPTGGLCDAAVAGLLAGLAAGHSGALADLEDRLLELGLDAVVEKMDAIDGYNVAGIVRAVLEE